MLEHEGAMPNEGDDESSVRRLDGVAGHGFLTRSGGREKSGKEKDTQKQNSPLHFRTPFGLGWVSSANLRFSSILHHPKEAFGEHCRNPTTSFFAVGFQSLDGQLC
jgi:hypothetical protein